MKTTPVNSLARHPLAPFFLVAFALSRLNEVALALRVREIPNAHLPFGRLHLNSFDPGPRRPSDRTVPIFLAHRLTSGCLAGQGGRRGQTFNDIVDSKNPQF
jgi:hypothetical protein